MAALHHVPSKAAAAGSSGQGVMVSGSLSVFLTNLRLLDLDRLPDWPAISPQTFATAGAGVQGQRRRVQCVEWALFRLFALWDPHETATVRAPRGRTRASR